MSRSNNTADRLIERLELIPHPEGGWYREVYRSDLKVVYPGHSAPRSAATDIYYLLKYPDFSSFHRLQSDELWHFYAGRALIIHELTSQGLKSTRLSGDNIDSLFQYVVKRNTWFAVELAVHSSYALVGCTMAPGFDFNDFEMADKEKLLAEFPENGKIVRRLCK